MSEVRILYNNIFRTVNLLFLNRAKGDEKFYLEWVQSMKTFINSPPEDHAAYEALDLAGAAIDKWTSTKSKETCATSLEDLKDRIAKNSKEEVPVFIALQYDSTEAGFLSICHFHRTWKNGLFLDFLVTHPYFIDPVLSGAPAIRWIGLATLYAVATIAKELDCPYIWGETTYSSQSFYKRIFDLQEIKDVFQIDQDRYLRFIEDTDKKIEENARN